ncbi:hypothetical protein P5V15_015076 [Pogonomyrmex californicus]
MHFQSCLSVMPRHTDSIHLRLEDASCMLTVIMTSAHQCWKLTNEQKIYAKTHLNETNETRKNAVAEIKHWIQENNDLRKRIDDFNILQYLRICKFNIEETKIRIQNYYKLRSNIPEWYTNKDPFRPELQILLNLGIFFFLRKPDNEGRMVFFARPSLFEPKISKLSDVIKIHSFRTMEDSFNNIPANILPNEYGGTGGPVEELTDYYKKTIEENRDWFINDE